MRANPRDLSTACSDMSSPPKFGPPRAGRLLGERVAYLKAERRSCSRWRAAECRRVRGRPRAPEPARRAVVRKLGVPFHPELHSARSARRTRRYSTRRSSSGWNLGRAIAEVTVRERAELLRRVALYRGNRPPSSSPDERSSSSTTASPLAHRSGRVEIARTAGTRVIVACRSRHPSGRRTRDARR